MGSFICLPSIFCILCFKKFEMETPCFYWNEKENKMFYLIFFMLFYRWKWKLFFSKKMKILFWKIFLRFFFTWKFEKSHHKIFSSCDKKIFFPFWSLKNKKIQHKKERKKFLREMSQFLQTHKLMMFRKNWKFLKKFQSWFLVETIFFANFLWNKKKYSEIFFKTFFQQKK